MARCMLRRFNRLAREFYSGRMFIALDTETTGLHSGSDYIIEIGAVRFSVDGICGEPFSSLVRPPVPVPEEVTEITGISQSDASLARPASEVLPEFMGYIGGRDSLLVAHNAPFDIGFINAELSRAGMSGLPNLAVDTLAAARWAYPGLSRLPEKGQYRLQSLAARFSIDVVSAHRALDDARVCMEIFRRIIADTRAP